MTADRASDLARRAVLHAALADPARLQITDTLLAGDASPSELAAMLAMPSNLLAHHLHVLEQAWIITRRRSEGDRRRTYLQLIPGALDSLAPPPARAALRVLFGMHRQLGALAPGRRAMAPGQHRPGGIGRNASGLGDRPRRHRRRRTPPPGAAPAAAPSHQRRPARGRPRGHGLRPGPRGTRRGHRGALVHPGPGAAWPPGSFDTGMAQLADRVGRLAPRLAAVS